MLVIILLTKPPTRAKKKKKRQDFQCDSTNWDFNGDLHLPCTSQSETLMVKGPL